VHLGLSAHRKKTWDSDTEAACFGWVFKSDSLSRWILRIMGGAVLKGQRKGGQKEVYGLGPQRLANHRDTIQRLLQTSNEAVIMRRRNVDTGGM